MHLINWWSTCVSTHIRQEFCHFAGLQPQFLQEWSKFSPRSHHDHAILRETEKKQKYSHISDSFKVHNSPIRKRLHQYSIFVSRRYMAAQTGFTKLHLNKLDHQNRSDQMKSTTFGKNQTAYQHKHLLPTVKHKGDEGLFCCYRARAHWDNRGAICPADKV